MLNRTFSVYWAIVMTFFIVSCVESSKQESDPIDLKVNELLSKMTVEEKVGQMTQVAVDMILKENSATEIDPAKLKTAILDKKVGSILNVKGRAYSLNEWHTLLNSIQKVAVEETPNKIPILYGIDAIHGANYIENSTLFPHNIGIAATRNLTLAKKGAEITALETRASGVRWNFDPVLGLGRQPLWSRFEETFGEDVFLTSTMGAATIQGYEGDGLNGMTQIASCMKHFMGYSVPQTGKDRTPAYIPEVQLRNLFLPPFQAAVEAGTSTVMINSGEVNGIPVHGSKFFLQDLLRDELGFEGLAVSDWEDIIRLHTRHKVAASPKEAVKIAVNAGVDLSMVPLNYSFYNYLLELVNEGEVPMARVDEAVARILKLKFKLGLFDNAFPEADAAENFGKESYKAEAKLAALESITLLKNSGNTLPIPKNAKILLAGPGADNVATLHGSWSYTWQGTDVSKYPNSTLTIKEAFENKLGKSSVISISEESYEDENNYNGKALAKLANSVDYVVLCLGENAYAESPGVIDALDLDPRQLTLAQEAMKTNKPVIVILTQGRPRVITEIVDGSSAILMAYRPGSQGASAIADIVFGDENPSGILPFTYPLFSGDVVLYDHKGTERIREDEPNTYGDGGYRPLYPFGYGLSYTTFDYSDLSLSSSSLGADETLQVSVKVKNTGEKGGKHAVEIYTKDLYASVTPAFKKLKGFEKISLAPGEEIMVSFTITKEDLSFINQSLERVTEPGEFEVIVGDLRKAFTYSN